MSLSDEERARQILGQMDLAEMARAFEVVMGGLLAEHLRAVRAEGERAGREQERERAARIAEEEIAGYEGCNSLDATEQTIVGTARNIAAAIRREEDPDAR